jgi:hypothetical protein
MIVFTSYFILWLIDQFLGNGSETNSRSTSVARRQILDKWEYTFAAREGLGKHVSAATDSRAVIKILLKESVLSALPTALQVVEVTKMEFSTGGHNWVALFLGDMNTGLALQEGGVSRLRQ